MNTEISSLAAQLIQAGRVEDSDVLSLRTLVWRDDNTGFDTLDALFLVNDRCAPRSKAWIDFFIEVIGDVLLHQTPPAGFLDEHGADWLRSRIDRSGSIATIGEIELLVALLENAENAPLSLKPYALAQIEATIVSGLGPTRDAGVVRPNCVDEAEVCLLRRLIFASGGEDAAIVGSQEADMLFRIKDATLGSENAPGWLTLFVQGVGNHLLAHSDYRPLSREEALHLNAVMESNTPSIARFFSRMLPGDMFGRGTIIDAFKSVFPAEHDLLSGLASIGPRSDLSAAEAAWLKKHIAADGLTDPFEKALMTFLLDEVGHMPAMLSEPLRRTA